MRQGWNSPSDLVTRWEVEMSVTVVCPVNRTDASEVWSDHNR